MDIARIYYSLHAIDNCGSIKSRSKPVKHKWLIINLLAVTVAQIEHYLKDSIREWSSFCAKKGVNYDTNDYEITYSQMYTLVSERGVLGKCIREQKEPACKRKKNPMSADYCCNPYCSVCCPLIIWGEHKDRDEENVETLIVRLFHDLTNMVIWKELLDREETDFRAMAYCLYSLKDLVETHIFTATANTSTSTNTSIVIYNNDGRSIGPNYLPVEGTTLLSLSLVALMDRFWSLSAYVLNDNRLGACYKDLFDSDVDLEDLDRYFPRVISKLILTYDTVHSDTTVARRLCRNLV